MADNFKADRDDDRTILRITGTDRHDFLQGLVSNHFGADSTGAVYAALLSPQGKYLADFMLSNNGDHVLVDIATALATDFTKRLSMYKLRADVAIEQTDLMLFRGTGDAPEGAHMDPRHNSLGWRLITSETPATPANIDWTERYLAARVPLTGVDLLPNDSYILEMDFERLHGVDFRKGCYVGQEVTARMKHKTELRKGLALLSIEGNVTSGAAIERDGKTIGRIGTVGRSHALAHIRFDRMGDGATVDGVAVAITP